MMGLVLEVLKLQVVTRKLVFLLYFNSTIQYLKYHSVAAIFPASYSKFDLAMFLTPTSTQFSKEALKMLLQILSLFQVTSCHSSHLNQG
jgi:hypothetical protein